MGALLFVLLLLPSAPVQEVVTGTVADPQGSTVPGATIQLEVGGAIILETRTGTDGRFTFGIVTRNGVQLIVTAPGFTRYVLMMSADTRQNMTITLEPAPFFEAVQVTSTRSDVPATDPTVTAAVFPASELMTSAQLSIDDALKLVPGFTLFPSSRVANPTTQTVMMRGLGGSGVNRSLVLADGVPLNDAFGGWVYWDKVPQAAIDRVEVVRGGGSDLYGADAVGGVIQILTLEPTRTMARAVVEGGNLETGRASMFGGLHRGRWALGAAGQWFTTTGYINVPVDERGAIESPVGSGHRSGMVSSSYLAAGWRLGGRANVFSEDRTNGTVVQVNDTNARSASAEIAGTAGGGYLNAHVFGGTQGYDETFSDIAPLGGFEFSETSPEEPPRSSERLSLIQRIPTRLTGASVQWTGQRGRSTVLVGSEARFVKGHAAETEFHLAGQTAASHADGVASDTGGSQRLASAFVRAMFAATDRLTLVTGTHADLWHSLSLRSPFSQTVGAFNPRLSVAYRFGDSGLTARASAAGGFRAPTLNELYRRTQRGNDITLPNEALTPERLRTVDGGVIFSRGRAAARVTGFWSLLDDTVTSVTVSTSPSLNFRQRQNADSMRSAGVELEADVRLPYAVSVAVTGAIIDSRFTGTRLRDFKVPQVAEYSLGVDVHYNSPSWTASTQLRVTGPQFDDDVNTRLLRRAAVVDAFVGRTLVRRVMAFVAVENLFDNRYEVGRIPIRSLGLPRAVRGGVQILFP
jgi:outer membrane receptor protein involved in Fe transport